MMIDSQQLFSNEQVLTASTASTNVIDLGVSRDIGRGEPMAIVVVANVSADAASGNETYQVNVQTDDNEAFSSATTLTQNPIDRDDLIAGSRHVIPLGFKNERYLRLNYALGGTTPSVTLTAFLQPMSMIASEDKVYQTSITIS